LNKAKLKAYGLIVAVFVLGALAGTGVTYASMRRDYALLASDESGEAREQRRFVAFRRQLGLDDALAARVGDVIARHRGERRRLIHDAFEQCGKPLLSHKAMVDAEIRVLLNPEQQKRFDALIESQREHSPFGRRSD
jgi:uncharacterized membrane protein